MALKFDPRTKLMLLITIGLVMMSGRLTGVEYILRLVCTAVPFLLLILIKRFKAAVVYAILLFGVVICEGFIVPYTNGAMNLVVMTVCGIISRFGPGYLMGWYFVSSTSVSEFITAMKKMHFPDVVTIPMSVMFRYFPTLKEEYLSIHDAMKMREVGRGVKNPFQYAEYVLVPIMMSTAQIANDLSAASLTKGLCVNNGRTHICRIEMKACDWFLVTAMLSMLVIFFMF